MTPNDQEKLRGRIEAFVGRRGQGSINFLAGESAYTRQYIGQFRGGRQVGWQFIKGLSEVLDRIEEGEPSVVREHSADYGEGKSPTDLLVEDLRLLADYLENPSVSKEMKAAKFSSFLDGSVSGRDEYIRLIEEGENN